MASRARVPVSGDKKVKVQTGVVKRLLKEVTSYEKEAVTNEARVQKMRDEGKDEYDIRKQEEVLAESYMMIPDSKRRLEEALQALKQCIEESQGEEGIDESTMTDANAAAEEASTKLGTA